MYRILVVEDEDDIQKILENYLIDQGYAVTLNIINLRKKWKGICSQVPFIVLKYRQGCI